MYTVRTIAQRRESRMCDYYETTGTDADPIGGAAGYDDPKRAGPGVFHENSHANARRNLVDHVPVLLTHLPRNPEPYLKVAAHDGEV